MTQETLDRAGLQFVFFGPVKVPRKLVSRAAAAIADARAQINSGPKRKYSTALQSVLKVDSLLAQLYTGQPLQSLDYFLAGNVEAAKALIAELKGE